MARPRPASDPELRDANAPAPLRRWNWPGALRWFAAEFLVVVTGVLVALALNSWWQDQQDAARERSYLRQLSVDLETNEQLARTTLEYMDERIQLGSKLLYALPAQPLPPRDSLDRWLHGFLGVAPLFPRMGTVQALIETGDLNLIEEDALRATLTDYVGAVQTAVEMIDETTDLALRANGEIYKQVDVWSLRERGASRAEWSALARNPAFRGNLYSIMIAHRARRRSASVLLESTIELQRLVTVALD